MERWREGGGVGFCGFAVALARQADAVDSELKVLQVRGLDGCMLPR
jgi:hypothetical protein